MSRPVRLLALLLLLLVLGVPAAGAWTWPVGGPVLQGFSFDPAHPYAGGQHRGIDVGGDAGASVLAPASGVVSFAGTVPTSGKSVTIDTADGLSVTLTHLGSIAVAKGGAVTEGTVVGTVGPSGTPELDVPYVHLGIRNAADPQGYLDPLLFLPVAAAPPAAAPAAAPVAPPAAAAPPADPAAAPPSSEAPPAPEAPAADPAPPAAEAPPAVEAPPADASACRWRRRSRPCRSPRLRRWPRRRPPSPRRSRLRHGRNRPSPNRPSPNRRPQPSLRRSPTRSRRSRRRRRRTRRLCRRLRRSPRPSRRRR